MTTAYDVKNKQKVEIQNPKIIEKKTKRGTIVRMMMETSPLAPHIKVFRILPKK